MSRRYVWRVLVQGSPVRHYLTRRAAEHRAEIYIKHGGYDPNELDVQRSQPVLFPEEPSDVR